MSYIEFDKEKLANIAFSKSRELLRCSRTGAFASTTLLGLNTRKYHGLFIVPQDEIDGERHVLVSDLNESMFIDSLEFRISIHQYKGGILNPHGNKYLQRFIADPIPTFFYRVGKFNFKKEILFLNNSDRIIVKYSILDNYENACFQFRPLLAFRQIHRLTYANNEANTNAQLVENGVKFCLYDKYTPVVFQASEPITYQHEPTWYKDVEYEAELARGYDGVEDLMSPGKISIEVKNKDIYFTIGTDEISPKAIEVLFQNELKQHEKRSSYYNCLQNAAAQFIVKRNGKTEIIAGYPWFGRWGRDTFIALPGLTLALNKPELCKEILDSMLAEMSDGLFPNIGKGEHVAYNSVDAPLWFIRTLQQYAHFTKTEKKIWKEYGHSIKEILNVYRKGSLFNIKMLNNGLIYAGADGVALTWMDAIVNGKPVTPRTGCQVEINALWYNSIKFAIEMAEYDKDQEFIDQWDELVKGFPAVFKETFWSKEKGYLADYVNGDHKNFQVRPNMMIVASLPYTPVSEKIKQLILKRCCEELLTEKGIRTLSPNDPEYKGHYAGTQAERDSAYHQGTCWMWLLAPFADGMLAVYGKSAIPLLERCYYNFEPSMKDYGISTIAEIADGDPPYKPNGCISQAWSVAAILWLKYRLEHEQKEINKI